MGYICKVHLIRVIAADLHAADGGYAGVLEPHKVFVGVLTGKAVEHGIGHAVEAGEE